jgi:hypothetical protein
MKTVKLVSLALMFALFGFSCSDNNNEPAHIRFMLTDMPADYSQVNIDVLGVEIKMNDTTIVLSTEQGVYNLLELVNGKDTLLVDDEIPAGKVSQVRLILGKNNSIMVGDDLHELKTPSAQQSGLKLNVHQDILPGESYEYIIDFLAHKSVVHTGSDKYMLKPVIKVYSEALTGSVEGIIDPAESQSEILAVQGEDSISTQADTESGYFRLRGLKEGAWLLEVLPEEGYQDSTLDVFSITAGQLLTLEDTIHLVPIPE